MTIDEEKYMAERVDDQIDWHDRKGTAIARFWVIWHNTASAIWACEGDAPHSIAVCKEVCYVSQNIRRD